MKISAFAYVITSALLFTACNEAQISGNANKTPTEADPDPTASTAIPLIEWTTLTAGANTVKIYVSSSNTQASDMNDGLSVEKPLKTLAAAQKKLRYGKPDWLLLKEGDTFNETLSGVYGGESLTAPMVITSYCDAKDAAKCNIRPTVVADTGLNFTNSKNQSIQFVDVVGLHFKSATYQGNEGNLGDTGGTAIAALYKNGKNILIENCLIEKFRRGIFFYTDGNATSSLITTVRVRRNVIVDTWVDATQTNGVYNVYGYDRKSNAISLSGVDGDTVIEENLFDHNGYNEARPAALKMGHNSTIARRGGTFGKGFVVRRNLFFRGGQEGINMENGGEASDNLFVEIPNPITGGMKHQDDYLHNGNTKKWMYPATPAIITGNVVMQSTKSDAWADGGGIDVFKPDTNAKIENNIVTNRTSTSGTPWGITCEDPIDTDAQRTAEDGDCTKVSIQNNVVVDWPKGLAIDGKQIAPLNTVSQLVDPNRDVDSYMQSLNAQGGMMGFIAQARLQSKAAWNSKYTAPAILEYFKAGYQMR